MKNDDFKKEWTKEDFSKMQKAIRQYFAGKTLVNHLGKKITFGNTYKSIDDILGLAYTSSSAYAMYGVCNIQIDCKEFDGYHFSLFAISKTGNCFALVWDKNEFEKCIRINKPSRVRTIDIIAKEWRDKPNGNSYFAVRVTINLDYKDERSYSIRYEYGYGEQLAQIELNENQEFGQIVKDELWRHCKQNKIVLRTIIFENCKKSDVKEFGK